MVIIITWQSYIFIDIIRLLLLDVTNHLFWKEIFLKKRILNIALLISFLATILVPLTGIHIHKLASVIFLALSITHVVIYRKKLTSKRVMLILLCVVSFFTGLFGMIFDEYSIILIIHRTISLAIIFFMAIHIYLYRYKLRAIKK